MGSVISVCVSSSAATDSQSIEYCDVRSVAATNAKETKGKTNELDQHLPQSVSSGPLRGLSSTNDALNVSRNGAVPVTDSIGVQHDIAMLRSLLEQGVANSEGHTPSTTESADQHESVLSTISPTKDRGNSNLAKR
jgi:hypothetical protein